MLESGLTCAINTYHKLGFDCHLLGHYMQPNEITLFILQLDRKHVVHTP